MKETSEHSVADVPWLSFVPPGVHMHACMQKPIQFDFEFEDTHQRCKVHE